MKIFLPITVYYTSVIGSVVASCFILDHTLNVFASSVACHCWHFPLFDKNWQFLLPNGMTVIWALKSRRSCKSWDSQQFIIELQAARGQNCFTSSQ